MACTYHGRRDRARRTRSPPTPNPPPKAPKRAVEETVQDRRKPHSCGRSIQHYPPHARMGNPQRSAGRGGARKPPSPSPSPRRQDPPRGPRGPPPQPSSTTKGPQRTVEGTVQDRHFGTPTKVGCPILDNRVHARSAPPAVDGAGGGPTRPPRKSPDPMGRRVGGKGGGRKGGVAAEPGVLRLTRPGDGTGLEADATTDTLGGGCMLQQVNTSLAIAAGSLIVLGDRSCRILQWTLLPAEC